MGYKFEVHGYFQGKVFSKIEEDTNYNYFVMYTGGSLIKALWEMRKTRKAGAGCVKLEWRDVNKWKRKTVIEES